jgi:glycosyltransferase involved in cell wall biosynthesis
MDREPLISVLTTFHNAERTVVKTVRSLLDQDYKNFEHILVNDGSNDNSVKIIKEVSDKRMILLEPGRVGRAEALNHGLNKARGKIVAILDADDLSLFNRLTEQKKQFDEDPNVTLVCANAVLIDENGALQGKTKFPVNHEDLVESLMKLNPFPHSSVMFLRKSAQVVGGYNGRCEKSIDYNFYLDLLSSGGQFKGNVEPLISLRSYPTSWGKNDQLGLQMRYGVIGLINYFQEAKGDAGILRVNQSTWLRKKQIFDRWFEKCRFQEQIEAKKILADIRYKYWQSTHGEYLEIIHQFKSLVLKDPWFWRYRGCNFSYPRDVITFLEFLDECEDKISI